MHECREEMLRQIEADARNFALGVEAAIREFAAGLHQERTRLDEAEPSCGGEAEQMKLAETRCDQAERVFYQQTDQVLRDFNAAAEQGRRAVG